MMQRPQQAEGDAFGHRLYHEAIVDRIYLGAIVHDVGKIGVRDVVLNKPGKLDADEMEEMRRHPAVGYQILSRVHGLETAAEIAHCHHERWNGEGYPRKLRSTDVPLSARIVAIADFWDAITSHRPYRVAMPRQKALELHPDTGGEAEQFIRLTRAYEELLPSLR